MYYSRGVVHSQAPTYTRTHRHKHYHLISSPTLALNNISLYKNVFLLVKYFIFAATNVQGRAEK
jgi:hypothetical protein